MDSAREVQHEPRAVFSITPRGRQDTSRRPSRHVLLTDDGVRIEAEHRPAALDGDGSGPVANRPDGPAIVVAHGFTGSLERPAVRRAAAEFTRFGGVVTFSFRGHGGSGGRSTVGDREILDLDAAVRWARVLGYRRVATVGFSMGGSVVVRQAAAAAADRTGRGGPTGREGRTGAQPDAVVAVSAPARWYYRGTAPMRRVHWVVTRPLGRAVSRYGLRTRIHPEDWDPVPPSPVECVPLIAPVPLLIVHGDRDTYFPLDHPRSLAEASGGAADLWIEHGFGHAENAAGPELLHRIGDWITGRVQVCRPGPPGETA